MPRFVAAIFMLSCVFCFCLIAGSSAWSDGGAQSAKALYLDGVRHFNGEGADRDLGKAASFFSQAAEKGHAGAQFAFALCLDQGLGVPKDQKAALLWYEKSARQGNISAQYNMGIAYASGEVVAEDQAVALEWFLLAARQGDADSQFQVGVRYEFGEGVKINLSKAVYWYKEAAMQGQKDAAVALADLKKLITEKNQQTD